MKVLISKYICYTAPIVQQGTSDQFSPKCNKNPRCETYLLFSVPNTTKVLTSGKRADIPRNIHPKYDRVKVTSLALNATKVLTSKAAYYFQLQIQQKSSPRNRLTFYPQYNKRPHQEKYLPPPPPFSLSIYVFYTFFKFSCKVLWVIETLYQFPISILLFLLFSTRNTTNVITSKSTDHFQTQMQQKPHLEIYQIQQQFPPRKE